ncbi:undecaprenyl-diphosphatase [Paenibacillus sp. XY044]|uniref:undecaprenyl-diphosphatase n=1 Tax=Paenibacillus sp. XY044 TaxID=2026089 RepID=UPI000B99AC5B|nr:undecaprenyl-diphosphatase [Paenibacillus sp. XY044]OZB98777.1 phosphatase PAP2 family protein [Paenibacillus sp. XY044]
MSIGQIDYQLFHVINEWGRSVYSLNSVMRLLAERAFYLFFVGLLVYWFTRKESNRRMVAESVVSAAIGLGISWVIGHLFYRDRPFVAHSVLQLIPHPANASFPSDHSIGAFAIAAIFVIYRRKEGIIWLILAASIAFSRVWTGVHYPLDVLGGALIGIICAAGVHRLAERFLFVSRWFNTGLGWYEKYESKILPRHLNKEEQIPAGK